MIIPSRQVLRELLARYSDARIVHEQRPGRETARLLADLSYTLCVMTSSRTIAEAVAAADAMLAERPGVDAVS
ncbi:DUF5133 domain-containing protein [Streptomyces sp. NRRL F-5126]|uniref:DUF5133 domain-containing protein n=1 Tax=Streptomyces sp. NRRL F-5126 TaxID=1463857 RepID=UPI0004CC28B7|nr:DUF5133 domain-containing protein [Streptomyces sp. NRRL F-5126]